MVQSSPTGINSAVFFFLLRSTGQYLPGSWKTTHLVCALLSTLTTCWFLTLYLPFVVMGASTVLELNSLVFFYYYFLLLLSKIVLVIWPTLSIEEIGVLFWKTSDTMLPKDRSHSWGQLNSDWTSPVLKLMLKHCDFKWRKTVYAYLYIKKYINCLWEVYLFIDKIVIIMI